ncbi:MAG: hypothetical protein ACOC5T_02400 [Elusimicrobiota bacterium]
MAYDGTIVTESEMQFYAGKNVSGDADTEEYHNQLAAEAEAYLCSLTKYDIVGNWDDLNSTYRQLFSEYAARYAAIGMITYDMSGYSSRVEAEDMINTNWARMNTIQKMLEDASIQDFLGVS